MAAAAAIALGRGRSFDLGSRPRNERPSALLSSADECNLSGADFIAMRASLACYGGLSDYSEGRVANPHNFPPTRYVSKLVIDPDKTSITMPWDITMIVSLLIVAIAMPVEVAMLEVRFDFLFVMNRVLDLLFIIDMVLQFFMMYPVKSRYFSYLEDRHHVIVRRYLTTWFAIDLVSVLPFDIVSLLSANSSLSKLKTMKVLRLLRMLKLARTLKASRIVRRLEVKVDIAYQVLRLLKFVVLLLFVAHWQACAWCATLRLVDSGTPRWVDGFPAQDSQPQSKIEDSPARLYMVSLYFAMYTMTSVGYGDVRPANFLERALCVVFLLLSGLAWAYIIGQVTSIVSKMGLLEKRYRDMLDEVNYMLWDRGIGADLQKRLRAFFLSTRQVDRYTQQWKLQAEMSIGLQGQVAMMTHAVWIDKIVFLDEFLRKAKLRGIVKEAVQNNEVHFHRVPPFILEMSLALRFKMYAQEEYFGQPNVLYILSLGIVMRHDVTVLRQGQVWGEDFVLQSSKLLTPFVVLCLSYVEVRMLERDAFQYICERHRKEWPDLAHAVRRHVVRVAVRRGIIVEARKRKAQAKGHASPLSPFSLSNCNRPVFKHSSSQLLYYEQQDSGLVVPGDQKEEQSQALWEDVSDLKELQQQNDDMMRLLAKHEARLAEKLRGAASSPAR